MTNEKELTPEEKKMEMHLAEWETYNNQVCDVLEAIDTLTDHQHPYAVSLLACELVKIAEARQEALDGLKVYGIRNHEDALFAVCRKKEQEKKTA